MRRAFAALFVVGCAGAPGAGPTVLPEQPDAAAPHCRPVDVARADAAFERARAFLELIRKEEHPPSDLFERGVRDLLEAAENGNLEGQYRYANVVFGFLFTDHAPEPADEADYVRAFKFYRVAALRGHPTPLKSFPGIDQKTAAAMALEEPLASIPKAWLDRAFEQADAWLLCAPAAARTRFVPAAPPPDTRLQSGDSGWTRSGDPEGPLLRVTAEQTAGASVAPPVTTRWLAALPQLHACYLEWLAREAGSGGTLTLRVDLPEPAIVITGAGDDAMKDCAKRAFSAVTLPKDVTTSARLELALFPRALSAPALPEAEADEHVDRWEVDGSCWRTLTYPCAPNKRCMAPSRERVRCPNKTE